MLEKLPQAAQDKDLIAALVCSVVAAVIMSYVLGVGTPKLLHAVLGLVTIGLVVAAYMSVARAQVDRDWQARRLHESLGDKGEER